MREITNHTSTRVPRTPGLSVLPQREARRISRAQKSTVVPTLSRNPR